MEYRKQQELNQRQVIYDDLPVSRPVPIRRPETKIQMPTIVQPIALSPMVSLQESVVLRQADASEYSSAGDYTARAEDEDGSVAKKQRSKIRFGGFLMLLFSLIYLAPFILPLAIPDLAAFDLGNGMKLSVLYSGQYNVVGVIMGLLEGGMPEFSMQLITDNIVAVVLLVSMLFAVCIFLTGLIKLISGGGKKRKGGAGAYIAFSVLVLLCVIILAVFNIVGMEALGITAAAEIKDVFLGNDMAITLLLVTSFLMLIMSLISGGIARNNDGYTN